jgi:hypothetical protein
VVADDFEGVVAFDFDAAEFGIVFTEVLAHGADDGLLLHLGGLRRIKATLDRPEMGEDLLVLALPAGATGAGVVGHELGGREQVKP